MLRLGQLIQLSLTSLTAPTSLRYAIVTKGDNRLTGVCLLWAASKLASLRTAAAADLALRQKTLKPIRCAVFAQTEQLAAFAGASPLCNCHQRG
ncbi:MAG: hypothetical protein GX318_09400 [Clostridia bacterium]|nr:hypothetical protein [Clostridia bacterium]